jgi:hypothetical protein
MRVLPRGREPDAETHRAVEYGKHGGRVGKCTRRTYLHRLASRIPTDARQARLRDESPVASRLGHVSYRIRCETAQDARQVAGRRASRRRYASVAQGKKHMSIETLRRSPRSYPDGGRRVYFRFNLSTPACLTAK